MKKGLKLAIAAVVLVAAVAAVAIFGFGMFDNGPYTVTFLGPDGATLHVDEVNPGEAAEPPVNPVMPQGYVFSHWDRDFSSVTEDMEVYAVCIEWAPTGNVLAIGGGYTRRGGDVTVPLQLSGQVCLCAFDVRITYDTEALDFVEFAAQDGAVDANCIEEEGVIYLNYASVENTVGEVDLADLVFTAIGEPGQTSMEIEVSEIIAFDEAYEFYVPEYTAIPATVTISG